MHSLTTKEMIDLGLQGVCVVCCMTQEEDLPKVGGIDQRIYIRRFSENEGIS